MEENKKKKNKKSIGGTIFFLVCIIAGGFVGWYGGDFMFKIGMSTSETWLVLLASWGFLFLHLIMHEVGHLICGFITGYKFVSFRIENIILYKKQGKLHFGKYSLAGTGGQCLMAPPEMEDGKMPYKLYNLGGSLMNLLIAAIAVVLYFVTSPGIVVQGLYIVCAALGFLFALGNGIPMRLSVDNDGYNAMSLGKNPHALRALWIQLKVNQMQTEGIRLKDMPREWFTCPAEEDMGNNMVAAIAAMRCSRLIDEMNFKEAGIAINEVLDMSSGMIPIHHMLLRVEQIFCEILGERREEVLAQIHDKQLRNFMKSMKDTTSVLRTQFAYALLIEEDEEKAAKWKKKFEKKMKKHPIQGDTESEQALMEYCENIAMNTK